VQKIRKIEVTGKGEGKIGWGEKGKKRDFAAILEMTEGGNVQFWQYFQPSPQVFVQEPKREVENVRRKRRRTRKELRPNSGPHCH